MEQNEESESSYREDLFTNALPSSSKRFGRPIDDLEKLELLVKYVMYLMVFITMIIAFTVYGRNYNSTKIDNTSIVVDSLDNKLKSSDPVLNGNSNNR